MSNRLKALFEALRALPDIWLVLFVLVFALVCYVGVFALWHIWEPKLAELSAGASIAFFTMLKVRAEHQPGPPNLAPATIEVDTK